MKQRLRQQKGHLPKFGFPFNLSEYEVGVADSVGCPHVDRWAGQKLPGVGSRGVQLRTETFCAGESILELKVKIKMKL